MSHSRRAGALLAGLLVIFAAPLAGAASVAPESREQMTLSFAPVVKRAIPAVVNIYTRHTERVSLSPFLSDPFFSQFLGEETRGLERERVVHSLGSGVIVGSDGVIVTSYHVVKGSEAITVALGDKREFEAHVAKLDERADLAVLRVDTHGAPLPALPLRDSDTLEVGDLVLAIGNPFGVGQTVTSGIVSALARRASDVSDYQFFIQTDAAINPGNSGGALIDMQGRLAGINTAIYSHTGGYQGIGFAIPANMVRAVLGSEAGKNGAVLRPWFGVVAESVTAEIAEAQGLAPPQGVLIQQVAPGSPAAKAGIRPGDILLAFGQGGASEVNDPQSLNFRMAVTGLHHETLATLWRAGKRVTVPVTLAAAPEDKEAASVTLHGAHPMNGVTMNGVTVRALTAQDAERLRLPIDSAGVLVLNPGDSEESGLALAPDDVIVAVDGAPVTSVAELERQLARDPHRLQIKLLRQGAVFTMTLIH